MLAVFMREKIDKPFLYMFKEHQRYVSTIFILIASRYRNFFKNNWN